MTQEVLDYREWINKKWGTKIDSSKCGKSISNIFMYSANKNGTCSGRHLAFVVAVRC